MAAIQNFKNFLRHGKQARQNAEPTSSVSPVHAQQHRAEPVHHGISEPALDHKPLQHAPLPHGDYSVAAGGDNRNIAAQAGAAADRAADKKHKQEAAAKGKGVDPEVLERIVAEEREAKGKLPKYPGLERWQILEKMGDGAFSNVQSAGYHRSVGRSCHQGCAQIRNEFPASQYYPTFLPSFAHSHFSLSLPLLSYRIAFASTLAIFGRYQHDLSCLGR